jgi:hypothetical protein
MGEVSMTMSLPLDSDGFLRRECPKCRRQFKWHPTAGEQSAGGAPVAVEAYFCPYCYEPADLGAWWTQEQLEHAQQIVVAEGVGPALRRFKRQVESTSRHSGGFLRLEAHLPPLARPEPLTEPDDMMRVDFPCHPEEPIKVDDAWEQEVACLVCGIRYPAELVRVLPDAEPGL